MTTVDTAATEAAAPQRRRLVARPSTWVVWALVAAFFIFLIGILVSVLMDSFGRRWFGGWLPEELTTDWYAEAWDRFNMTHVIGVTVGVDRKSTRLNSSHVAISYAVFCLKKKKEVHTALI